MVNALGGARGRLMVNGLVPLVGLHWIYKTLINCHLWGCQTYVLESKFNKTGVKISKWYPRSQRRVDMGFRNIHSTKVGLVLNLLTDSISPQYHVVFDDMLSNVVIIIDAEQELWINMVTSRNSRIQVMLDQEDDPELDDERLTADEQLTRFRKVREKILGRVKE